MECYCNNNFKNAIILVRGNDTNFNDATGIKIYINTTVLDLSTFKAVFKLGNITKTFDDISSGEIELNFTAAETAPLQAECWGTLNLIDNSKRVATIENRIPFRVISIVDGNAIATQPYTLNFDVKQGGETILNISVESAVSVEVGQTTTLPPGSEATVTNAGTPNHLILNFGIPRGFSPIANVSKVDDTATISITDIDGTTTTTISDGRAITNIAKTSTSGLVDTYTISYSDNTTSTFDVTNGFSPTANVIKSGDTATISITDIDGTTTAIIKDGVGIVNIEKTATSGLVDTYTITYTNGETKDFTVTNGFSPIANVTKSGDTATISITDENGTTTTTISDGRAITNIAKTSTSGLVDTYTISYSDNTTSTFNVANGKGITSIAKTSTSGLVDTYTITYNDGTSTTYTVTNGKAATIEVGTVTTGAEGTNASIINSGTDNAAVFDFVIPKGDTGSTGNGISSIAKTSTSGLVDTYTITYTSGATTTFNVANGNGVSSITKTATSGLTDTYTIAFTDGTSTTYTVTNGKGISSIAKTSSSGLTDTYTITYNDGDTDTYNVTNGFTPTASVTKSGDTATITITDIDATTTATITDGRAVSSITKTSTSGLVDTYTITYSDNTTSTFDVTNGFSPSASVTKVDDTATISITDENGTTTATITDGFSPSASVTKVDDTATISITDIDGTTTATITDGFSPTASVSKVSDTATITITDINGTTTASITDGIDGTNGVSVTGVELISTVGLAKTYRMSFSNNTYYDYVVMDGAAGATTWGGITGYLSNQTDLYNILAELSVNQSLEDYLDLIIDGNTANLPIVITNPYNQTIADIITGA